MAAHAHPSTPSAAAHAVSPKVTAATLAAFLAPVLVAVLDAVTVDQLGGLGVWSGIVLAGIAALSAAVAGYARRDPLRH